jgi:hypothetical protein
MGGEAMTNTTKGCITLILPAYFITPVGWFAGEMAVNCRYWNN